ncbi:MAG: hypothetical protein PHU85_09430 [Phycisphaerae bacterium]|nr:hypothetical protein [Phycisphaerae bacterium]
MVAARMNLALLAAAIALAGCQQSPPALPTGAASNPILVDAEFQPLFAAARAALREHRFTIAREDPRLGEIVTEPLTGQQMWEVWRADAAGLYNQLEGSMHTILRTLDVRIYPARDEAGTPIPGKHYLEVRAYTDRLSMPEHAFTAVNQLPKDYKVGRGLVDSLELEAEEIDKPRRVFLGRDNLLEDWMIRDIMRRSYSIKPPAASQPE